MAIFDFLRHMQLSSFSLPYRRRLHIILYHMPQVVKFLVPIYYGAVHQVRREPERAVRRSILSLAGEGLASAAFLMLEEDGGGGGEGGRGTPRAKPEALHQRREAAQRSRTSEGPSSKVHLTADSRK